MATTLSLVVPLFNEGVAARDVLEHALSLQGFDEITLVDASDDIVSRENFLALCVEHQRVAGVQFLISDKPGRALQMNLAASKSSCEVLVFLHCDTRLPAAAAQLIETEIAASYQWGRFNVRLDGNAWGVKLVQLMMNLRSRLRRLATGDQVIFVNRQLFESVGGYPNIPLMEDIAISSRLSISAPALITQPATTSARRWQQRGVVRTILLMWGLRLAFWLGVSPHTLARWYGQVR